MGVIEFSLFDEYNKSNAGVLNNYYQPGVYCECDMLTFFYIPGSVIKSATF